MNAIASRRMKCASDSLDILFLYTYSYKQSQNASD